MLTDYAGPWATWFGSENQRLFYEEISEQSILVENIISRIDESQVSRTIGITSLALRLTRQVRSEDITVACDSSISRKPFIIILTDFKGLYLRRPTTLTRPPRPSIISRNFLIRSLRLQRHGIPKLRRIGVQFLLRSLLERFVISFAILLFVGFRAKIVFCWLGI